VLSHHERLHAFTNRGFDHLLQCVIRMMAELSGVAVMGERHVDFRLTGMKQEEHTPDVLVTAIASDLYHLIRTRSVMSRSARALQQGDPCGMLHKRK